jgi:hypothetical protein
VFATIDRGKIGFINEHEPDTWRRLAMTIQTMRDFGIGEGQL